MKIPGGYDENANRTLVLKAIFFGKVEIDMRIVVFAILAALLFGACSEPRIGIDSSVQNGPVKIYKSGTDPACGTIVLTTCNPGDDSLWHDTASKIAALDYRILVCDPAILDSGDRTILPGTDRKTKCGYALVGYGDCAQALLRMATNDSMLNALVFINPVFADTTGFSELSIPVVVIASTEKAAAVERTRKHYETLSDPKKWVELVTDINDLRMMQTHLEPIVRRVIVMLADRYVKQS
ncbi:hypothetical protein GF407_03680 [candidate division KSB1 bacterium]|nr:hypothetical protein [candidate division KSB1 bacterium]